MNSKIRINYMWNMIGSIASALVSTLLLLLASRNLNPIQSDTLGITYSLSQQLYIIGLFQVRNFQSTDTKESFPFSAYFYARILTIFLMLVSTLIFIGYSHFEKEKALVLFLIVSTRALDALSDVFQGYYQQHHLSFIAGKILFFRSLVTIIVFGLVVALTHSLLIASFAMFLSCLLLTFAVEYRYFDISSLKDQVRSQWIPIKQILQQCFPLFLNGFLITYIFTEPKLVIDQLIASGELMPGMQRDFNILFMPTFILNLLFAILRPLITELAYKWTTGETKVFFIQISRVAGLLIGIGLIGMIAAYFIGTPILSVVFGVNLRAYRLELVILIAAGIFNVLATMIDSLVTIFRKQSHLLTIYIVTFMTSKIITGPFIKQAGLTGAAFSFLIVMAIYFLFSLAVFRFMVKRLSPKKI